MDLNKIYLNHLPVDNSNEIYFELISMSSLDEMHEYSVKEEFYEYFEFNPFKSKADTEKYLKKLINRTKVVDVDIEAMYWFVRRKKDNLLIGTAALSDINFERKSAEIGYGISPDLWGNVFALQIIETLKHYQYHYTTPLPRSDYRD